MCVKARTKSRSDCFCADVLTQDVFEAAAKFCQRRCQHFESRGLALRLLDEVIRAGQAAEADMVVRFENRLVEQTWSRDGINRKRTARLLYEVRMIHFEGRLPEPEERCLQGTALPSSCPLTTAHAMIQGATDWAALGRALSEQEAYEHATAAFFRATSLEKGESLTHLASIFASWGDYDLALPAFGRVIAEAVLQGNSALSTAVRISAIISTVPPIVPPHAELLVLRKRLRADLEALARLPEVAVDDEFLCRHVGRTFFHLAHQCLNEIYDQQLLAAVMRRAAPALKTSGNNVLLPSLSAELRLGFVSAYLIDHSIGKMLAQVIALLADRFHVTVFHLSARPSGDDSVRTFVDTKADVSVMLTQCSLAEARAKIASATLDVLVFPDIGMESRSYFLAFARLAKVQCVWWGHPVTPGLHSIDFYISLDTEIDVAALNHYGPEQLVRVDSVNTAPFVQILDLRQRLLDEGRRLERTDVLDETISDPGGPIYLVLGRLFKLHPDFDRIIIDLLETDGRGVLVLIAEPQRPINAALWRRLRYSSGNATCVLDRIHFADYWNYVNALALADVVLDTYPYGGCLTALDALSNSKPFVTLPGPFERGRFAMSIYRQIRLTDFIARDPHHFVQLATSLANNPDEHARAVDAIQHAYPKAERPELVTKEWARMFLRMSASAV